MAGAGDGGDEYHQLDGSQHLLLDVMTTQMQCLLNHNNEQLYGRIEGLENQLKQNTGRHYGGNRVGNVGPRQKIMEGQNKIEGVELNVPAFKGRNNPNAYLDQEMKIEHVFSCNDYTEEQKVKLAALEFLDYAFVWWNKNQREMMREIGREIDTWTEMKRVMRKRYVPTGYNRTMRQKLQRLSQESLTMEEYYKERELTLVRANSEE